MHRTVVKKSNGYKYADRKEKETRESSIIYIDKSKKNRMIAKIFPQRFQNKQT